MQQRDLVNDTTSYIEKGSKETDLLSIVAERQISFAEILQRHYKMVSGV
jgi:hypothetical protein